MAGSSWSVEVEPLPFGEKEFQSFRTDSGITFCLWPACPGGQVPVPGGSLPRSRSGRPVEPVNPLARCPGPEVLTSTGRTTTRDGLDRTPGIPARGSRGSTEGLKRGSPVVRHQGNPGRAGRIRHRLAGLLSRASLATAGVRGVPGQPARQRLGAARRSPRDRPGDPGDRRTGGVARPLPPGVRLNHALRLGRFVTVELCPSTASHWRAKCGSSARSPRAAAMHIYASWPTTGQVGKRIARRRQGGDSGSAHIPASRPVRCTRGAYRRRNAERADLARSPAGAPLEMNLASWPLKRRSFATVAGNELGTGPVVPGWS